MLIKLLGWAWIIMGIIFLIKPEMLRNRLQKKSVKKIRKYLFAIVLALSSIILSIAWNTEGILAKIVFAFGVIGIFKSIFLIKVKTSEKLIEWFIKQPVKFFRVFAFAQIVFGIMLLFLK